eukprot:52000_1
MENLGSTKTTDVIEVTSPIDDDTDEKEEASNLNLNVGDRILTAGGMGVVRFIGGVHFDERERIGIELDEPSPNGHNGIIDGHKYFCCRDGHGCFIRNNSTKVLKYLGSTRREHESRVITNDRDAQPTTQIGDRIVLDTGARGRVAFIGDVYFCNHKNMLGIVLDEWSPNAHNGSIAGDYYFDAPDGKGSLIPLSTVQTHFADFKMGDRVNLWSMTGVVRYIGIPDFFEDELIGIELDTWSPNAGDGSINGQRLFDTIAGRAYFTPPTSLMTVIKQVKLSEGAYAKLQFNGKMVQLVTWIEKKERWKVKLLHAKRNKKYLRVKEDNLDLILDWKPVHKTSTVESLDKLPNVGDKVKTEKGMYGVVKFIGDVEFNRRYKYIGLELERWHPNAGNGTIQDQRYFETADGRAYFVQLEDLVQNLGKSEEEIKSTKHIKKLEEEKKHNRSRLVVTSLPYSIPFASVPTAFKVVTVCNLSGSIYKSEPSELIKVPLEDLEAMNGDEKET